MQAKNKEIYTYIISLLLKNVTFALARTANWPSHGHHEVYGYTELPSGLV